eukprot:gnl/Spiro4/27026_TR13443_c0_g1_i1.p1 gnl/Spiro4/27026_TR13443_c0_g1~~gnl/Spiro4/27026_TR13443_c0_g1_i1.p1  ORF type:complete len:175 (-),score=16.04 gnl/Spiro4/27026_TR13443_c0_g1_i1:48-572(-)
MGCNSSKSKDIENSRRPRVAVPPVGGQASPSTQARGIPGATASVGSAAKSYTENRMMETDLFVDVVDRAAQKFIDISQTPAPLEGKDAVERSAGYASQIASLHIQRTALFSLPGTALTSGNVSLHSILSQPSDLNEIKLAQTCARQMQQAYASMHIVDIGELVVTLPDYSAVYC